MVRRLAQGGPVVAEEVAPDPEYFPDDPFDVEDGAFEGGAVVTARRNLKEEAVSVEHLLLHATKNPHCPQRMQAFGQRTPNRRRKPVTAFEKFGDMITLDHVDTSAEDIRSFAGDKHLLVIYDLATGSLGAYPVQTKGAEEALMALRHFAGCDEVKQVYSDRAPALVKAVAQMTRPPPIHTTSIPGVPQTNSIAESRVRIMVRGMRVMLLSAGLPNCY